MMLGLATYWISTVKMLDRERETILQMPKYKEYHDAIDRLVLRKGQATADQYAMVVKQQEEMVQWERSYYELLRKNMVGLSWVAVFIGLCQVVGVYYIRRRLKRMPT